MNPFIDTHQFSSLVGDSPSSFQPIIADFSNNTKELIQSMHLAIEQQDSEALYRPLHQLKGSSGMLGMTTLFNACKDLESLEFDNTTKAMLDNLNEISINSISESYRLLDTTP